MKLSSFVNFCSTSTILPLISIKMLSLGKNPFDVRKGLTVFQNFLLLITPSAVAFLKKSFLALLFNELQMFLPFYMPKRFHVMAILNICF